MDYKINKKNDAAKNETPNNIVNDKSAEESALEENSLEKKGATNGVSNDENSDAADVGLHDSNLVTPDENNKD